MLSASEIQRIYKIVQGFKSIQVKYIPRGLDLVHCTQTEQTQQAPHLLEALATCLYLRYSRQEQAHTVRVCCHHTHTAGNPAWNHCWWPFHNALQSRKDLGGQDQLLMPFLQVTERQHSPPLILPWGNPPILSDGCGTKFRAAEHWLFYRGMSGIIFPSPPEK